MRILSVNKFNYLKGGCERYYFDLNKLCVDHGYQVIPFAMSHPENKNSQYQSFFVSEVDYSSLNSLKEQLSAGSRVIYSREAEKRIDALIKKTKPQIGHLHNIAHQLSPSILYALKQSNIPIIQTLHDFKLICPSYTMYTKERVCERCINGHFFHAGLNRCNKGSLFASLINVIEMYTHMILHSYDKVDLFIAPSQFLRQKVIDSGVSSERILQLSYFIDSNKYLPNYHHDNYLLYFGRLVSVKGVDVLLKAMKEMPHVHLVIAGRGEEEEKLKLMAERYNLNVSFVGFQEGKKLEQLIQNSMAVIVPSVWYENQPFAILESFAYGKVVIASQLGGMAELIDDGKTGYLFEAGNAEELAEKIRLLIDNSSNLPEMGSLAREKIEQEFAPEHHFEKINAVYSKFT